MTNLQEVPTEELLLFQDFTPIHSADLHSQSTIPVLIDVQKSHTVDLEELQKQEQTDPLEANEINSEVKSFWTLKYYQKYFDVDTVDVLDRILSSMIPRRNDVLTDFKLKPDLYGPFWISTTLIFTIAISGNIASYLQHANTQYHWKYDFHLVSYAATAILLYISVIPLIVWGVLKWSTDADLKDEAPTGPLELICVYGYSLFIYIPVSILWSIQVGWFQWMLVLIGSLLSGSVLVYTVMPALRYSRQKIFLILGVISCHLLLAAGFMLYFFHVPNSTVIVVPDIKPLNGTSV